MDTNPTLIALLHGPDQPGLVARVAGWIFERGGNILHADQHRDTEAGVFFQRIEWEPAAAPAGGRTDLAASEAAFRTFGESLGMQVRILSSADRPRVAMFVSKADHCFHDLALRWRAGEFAGELVAVVSNHLDLAAAAQLKPFETCRVLYRFLKLGLIAQGPRRSPESEPVPSPLSPGFALRKNSFL